MAKLTCIIQSSAIEQSKSAEALQFIRAAAELKHDIACVFFYRDAVDHALATPLDNTRDLIEQWEALSARYAIPLVVCHTVAERKGINDFHPAFDPSGLTALAKATADSDRTLQF